MTKDRIMAQVLLQIETARDIDVNRHIATALTKLNEVGIERDGIVTVDYPSEGETGTDPATRTSDQGFNYYEALRCLILPDEILSVDDVYVDNTQMTKSTMDLYKVDLMASLSYAINNSKEMYLSFDAEDGDEITISGRWALRNLELIPDNYENWLLNHVLMGLYLQRQYKNIELFKYYRDERDKAWRIVKNSQMQMGEYIAKDGLLQ